MTREIQKLDLRENVEIIPIKGSCHDYCLAKSSVLIKINELVDAVNKLETMAKNTNTVLKSLVEENNVHEKQIDELQMKLEPEKCEIPVDPYAKQRGWIGKLCRFWDDDNTNSSCGILTSIDTETFKEPQFVCNDEYDYEHCEPVKPDDDIIYKG